ncbi:hypothetical protein XENORESO_011260, partial [Xenotaenia resolanae]
PASDSAVCLPEQQDSMATVAVSPSEYLQPSTASTQQDTQPSPLALLAATCSKIGPPAAQAPVTSPPTQPQPRRLQPIKPAPIAPAPPKNLGFLSAKGNVIQLPAGLGPSAPGSPIVLTIQQSPARTNTSGPTNIQYQVMPQIQMMPQGGQIQLIPGTNQAIITTPMTVPAPAAAAATPVTPQKTVAIKPSPKVRKPNNTAANVMQLSSGLTLPLNVATGEVGGSAVVTETAASPPTPGKGRRGRKKKMVLPAEPPPAPAQAASPPPEQMETILIEAGDNIIQAGNNLLIVQSPGQPAMVQQVQVVQPKTDSQLIQIPQQALKVVKAASATLPPVPQKQPVTPSLQVTPPEPAPTQILFKTASGEWQSVQIQDPGSKTTSPTTSVAPTNPTSTPATSKRTQAGIRKERTLAKIAPAGGMIAFSPSQLSSAAQAVQTISINGVQVQGVPVTITNAGGQQHLTVQTMHGGGLQLATTQGQPALQVDQALTLELPSQPGEKKRRMACTCPNCKDADKR